MSVFSGLQLLHTKIILVLGVLLSCVCQNMQAQERCGTVEHQQQLSGQLLLPQREQDFENWLKRKIQKRRREVSRIQSTYQIPVVVHVIHNGEAIGTGTNISVEQIQSQIDVLNKDFNRLNADASNTPAEFLGVAGSMSIQFVLAKQTPEGCQTNGILRIDGKALTGRTSWTSASNTELKSLSVWPTEDYLNLWVCNLTDYLGYAQFPVSDLPGLEEYQNGLASTDGAVFSYKVFGSADYGNFNLDPQYNKGRTATHELGHFFGLRHIWGDKKDCTGTDYVEDTPTQKSETFNCPSHPLPESLRCFGLVPMFQNFLDYTDDVCMNLFTVQQVERMITVLESSPRRTSLLTSHGLDAPTFCGSDVALLQVVYPNPVTPGNQPQPVVRIQNLAEPLTSLTILYQSNANEFQEYLVNDLNLNAGEITDITLPAVLLNGVENTVYISLTAPNGEEDVDLSNNETEVNVVVSAVSAALPAAQGFEDSFADTWVSNNLTGSLNWEAYELSASVTTLYVNAFDDTSLGEKAWFVTPSVDFTDTQKAFLSFYYSYAPRVGKADEFEILISTDCGDTYQRLESVELSGTEVTTAWRPRSSADWKKVTVNLDAYKGYGCVRLAFVFTNGNGNNLYLDEIVIGTPSPFTLYPNPASTAVNISFNLIEATDVLFQLIDARGAVLGEAIFAGALDQVQTYYTDTLKSGLYFVRIQTNAGVWVEKLIVVRQ